MCDVRRATSAGGVPLTVCAPSHAVRRGVVVLHEIWGVTPSIGAVTRRLAGAGYAVAAPHLYHRQDSPIPARERVNDALRLRRTLTASGIDSDVRGAIDYLAAAGATKVGVLGFSMGGTIALWAAAHAPIDAAVSMYGGGIARTRWRGIDSGTALAADLRVPWLGLYGDGDSTIPVAQVERLRTALSESSVDAQVVRYPGVGHGFVLDPLATDCVPAEAEDAWRRTVEFFGSHLG
ncbi:carboxymethylenebutenolidase [Antricoccus suffuscus]|uniref:Carboxymethylenebutenolidase n=1 Tax=Antricoccus suffuscus TaxID=1629062 RepID=A0A2T0ZJU5_9ACTN|nr:dienelactone hydrolase family protein [Antricoccus suffuscus]PRZ36609.1 carboxymethylenebutenolidase [Antricoccus suffuscus]